MYEPRTAQSSIRPGLRPGLTLLHRPSRRSTALHRLVVDQLATATGESYWVDATNDASTYALYDLAPHSRTLSDVQVARAFTAYQHHSLVADLTRRVDESTSLVVVPAVESLYRDDDVPPDEGETLLASSLARLADLGRTFDVPVLATTTGEATTVAAHADAEIECTRTSQGFRYETDSFATTLYLDDGHWQTTIPYWVELFGAVSEADPFAVDCRADALGLEV